MVGLTNRTINSFIYLLNFAGLNCNPAKFIMTTNDYKGVSESAMEVIKAEMLRRGMVESENAKTNSSMTNVDMSMFSKGDILCFDPKISGTVLSTKIRNSNNSTDVVFVMTLEGDVRTFYPSCMRRAIQEAKENPVAGEKAILTGNTFIANRVGFVREGELSDFAKVCMKFTNDAALFASLAKHSVFVHVVDKKIVRGRVYQSETQTRNQNVMFIDFVAEGKEREALIAALEADAKAVIDAAA